MRSRRVRILQPIDWLILGAVVLAAVALGWTVAALVAWLVL